MHASTKTSPFLANYGYHPTCTATVHAPTNSLAAKERLEYLAILHKVLQNKVLCSQSLQAFYHNQHTLNPTIYKASDMVWLHTRYIHTTCPSNKLDYKKIGPFEVIQVIGPAAYKLCLPPQMRIHPVFHTLLLEPVIIAPDTIWKQQEPPTPVIVDKELEYEVESILASKQSGQTTKYLVHWKGYPISKRTWEAAGNLKHAHQLLDAFRASERSN